MSSTIMFNSSFLFIILLAIKHTHLFSSLDVLPCIPLHVLSSCTFLAFFDDDDFRRKKQRTNAKSERSKGHRLAICRRRNMYAIIGVELRPISGTRLL